MRIFFPTLLLVLLIPFQVAIGSPNTKKQSPKPTTAPHGKTAKPTAKQSISHSYWNLVVAFAGDSTKNTEPFTANSRWSISWDTEPGNTGEGNFAFEIHRVTDGQIVGTAANVVGKSKDKTEEYQAGSFYLSITATQKYTILVEELYDPIKFAQEQGPNTFTHGGNLPLVEAAGVSEDTSVVRSLLDMGASVDGKGRNGQTALIVASRCGLYDMVKLLLSKGADVNATDKDGATPLMNAAKDLSADCVKVVQLLISKGANVNMSDKNGQTALNQAVFYDPHENMVKALLDNGADVNKRDKYGFSPLDLAIRYAELHKEAPEVINLLKAAGAKSDETDSDGKHY